MKRSDIAADFASEIADKDSFKQNHYTSHGISVTKIDIDTEKASKAFSKPMGSYITVSPLHNWHIHRDDAMDTAKAICGELIPLLPKNGTVLVVGLGNAALTADNIGPCTASKIIATRHLKEKMPDNFIDFHSVAAISPGVLGVTGIETGEIVKGVAEKIKPSAVIAVDALSTSECENLCRTFQIANTGIVPGSGVGNFRFALTEETLGVPVIAVGVPTVLDTGEMINEILYSHGLKNADFELPLSVTPKDIDVLSEKSSNVIACAVNMALHEKIDAKELMEFMA